MWARSARRARAADLVIPGHDRSFRLEGGTPVYLAEAKLEILARLSPNRQDETVFNLTLR